jgi:hypothetical protein
MLLLMLNLVFNFSLFRILGSLLDSRRLFELERFIMERQR